MLLAGDPEIISEQLDANENSLILTPLQRNGLQSIIGCKVKIIPVVPKASPKRQSLNVLASTQNERNENKVITTKKMIVNELDTPDINQLELKNLRCSSTMV